ncbi:STM4012 family radical SAM protein [Actinocorallia populi]|uniref:STM4012 family radical SAM protein n=1 Tax=Actinocorallia populi TaxID=2079200 RepID=UPI001E4F7CC4|nr:STM4012 family radical SAM protein [Actinocorallia populi]
MKPYQGYVYAYPHKTAYRPLDPAPALRDVWRDEDTSRLFLYLHIPFCEIRCGFCNLFTRTGAPESLTTAYLDALERQAEATLDALGPAARFTQAAFGGGTPTYLTAPELARLCDLTTRILTHPAEPSSSAQQDGLRPGAADPVGFSDSARSDGLRTSHPVDSLSSRQDGLGSGAADPVGFSGSARPDGLRISRPGSAHLAGPTGSARPDGRTLRSSSARPAGPPSSARADGLLASGPGSASVAGGGRPGVPLAVETSPGTATKDRLEVLRAYGTRRVSIGVQSFVEAEARAAVRPQKAEEVVGALDTIRDVGFPVLNIDLIYGIDGQTAESWTRSIDRALEWRPEELYLYPLYIRPLTGLGRLGGDWDDQRLRLYRLGRDHLLSHGYEQVSMRMFRLPGTRAGGTEYSCQEDGMVGLGCGARSYTANLHYSFEYAVHATEVRAIIDDYVRTEDFTRARVGFAMTGDEHRRRHLLQSLLQAEGLDRLAYRARFGTDVLADFDLAPFARRGWLEETPGTLVLTPEGLAHSDALGPALFSPHVRALMDTYRAR